MSSFFFQIASMFYITLIAIAYFLKKKIGTIENKIYSSLIMIIIITLITDVVSVYLGILNPDSVFTVIMCKIYLVSLIAWIFAFTYYIFVISSDKNNGKVLIEADENYNYFKNKFKITLILFLISSIILLVAPLNVFSDGKKMYTYGMSATISYGISGICIVLWIIFLLYNSKNIKDKKYIPVFLFMILAGIAAIIQFLFPDILLVTSAATFVTILTYFTIENPDMKMIKELELARDQADKANRAKTDFLSSMSHEIRTPLNAIVGFSDCIETSTTLEEAKNNAKDIVNASTTLLEIVNGILDISKIEAGKLEIINSPYNARNTFEELAKLITPKMNEKGLDFSYYIAPDLPETLYGDHANMKKIVTNLLSNACKYTDQGFVRYEVNCINTEDSSKLIITVEDSGRGIKQENIDKLFTKFQRLDEDRNTTIEGTGLGLAITKQLIELMGGKIIVHTIYGEGSKFTVVITQKIEAVNTIEEPKKIRTTLDLKDEKILLVDDNDLNIKVAKKLLEKYNANCLTTVDSGFACLDKITSGEEYDLILLDDMMPKMSGVETLQKLKEIPNFSIPVVALTANAITGMREKYIAEGFNDYLSKPIEKEQLVQVLNEVLEKGPTVQLDILIKEKQNSKVEDSTPEIVETLEPEEKVEEDNSKYDKKHLKKLGVDIESALELLGDEEIYAETINDFLDNIDLKWQNIQSHKTSEDMPNYAIEVHSLKSDAKYLGFTNLATIAYEHELKSKENDIRFVNNHFNELEDELNKTLEIIDTHLKK